MKNKTITNETIFTTNWVKSDRRSVQASLYRRGYGRVLWWEINQRIHQLLSPKVALEEIMLSFHSRHHAITFFSRKFRSDVKQVATAIHLDGLAEGIRAAVSLH